MSSVLDDINKKRKGQGVSGSTTPQSQVAAPTQAESEKASESQKGVNAGKHIAPNVMTHADARKQGYEYFRNKKGVLFATRNADESEDEWKGKMALNRYKPKNQGIIRISTPAQAPSLPESVAYLDGSMLKGQQKLAAQTVDTPIVEHTKTKTIAGSPEDAVERGREAAEKAKALAEKINADLGITPTTPATQVKEEAPAAAPTQAESEKAAEGGKAVASVSATQVNAVEQPVVQETQKSGSSTPQPQAAESTSAPTAETPAQGSMTYTDLFKAFYPELTAEEKAAQQKRQRNRQIINAVGDGISALANLYYTNKSGVNAYDPSTSLTKAAKERYDKLLAQQREDEERYKELAYRSGAADIEMAYRRAKDAAADKRANKAADDAAEARRADEEYRKKVFEYNKEKDAADREERAKAKAEENKTKKYIADLNAEIRKEYNANLLKYKGAKASEKTLGKTLPFYNNEGEPIVIYENVWNTSRQQVYNDMLADGVVPSAYDKLDMTPAKKDEFIKENWMKSPKAVALMKGLALITPTTLPVQLADEDDYSQYAVGGDDYSQYIVE